MIIRHKYVLYMHANKQLMTKKQENSKALSSGKVKKPLLLWLGQINHLKNSNAFRQL